MYCFLKVQKRGMRIGLGETVTKAKIERWTFLPSREEHSGEVSLHSGEDLPAFRSYCLPRLNKLKLCPKHRKSIQVLGRWFCDTGME